MREELTSRQQHLLRVIEDAVAANGRSPSIHELMSALGVASPNGIVKHLAALESKGYIVREKGARGIRLVNAEVPVSCVGYVPIVGEIAAGSPIYAHENIEGVIAVPDTMIQGTAETFMLRIKGDSMIEDGIMNGDLVLIEKCDSVRDGEIAAVLVDDEATVKRLWKRGGNIVLEPANAAYQPIVVDPSYSSCSVLGRVIGLMRSYRHRIG